MMELSQKERAVIILFAERFEGTRTENSRLDRALDVIDHDRVSDHFQTVGGRGIQIDIEKLNGESVEYTFEEEPFNTLKQFLEGQKIPYSRRANTVGRIIMGVMDRIDQAKSTDLN